MGSHQEHWLLIWADHSGQVVQPSYSHLPIYKSGIIIASSLWGNVSMAFFFFFLNRVTSFVLLNLLCLGRQEIIFSQQPVITNHTDNLLKKKQMNHQICFKTRSLFANEIVPWEWVLDDVQPPLGCDSRLDRTRKSTGLGVREPQLRLETLVKLLFLSESLIDSSTIKGGHRTKRSLGSSSTKLL